MSKCLEAKLRAKQITDVTQIHYGTHMPSVTEIYWMRYLDDSSDSHVLIVCNATVALILALLIKICAGELHLFHVSFSSNQVNMKILWSQKVVLQYHQ